MGNIDKSKKEIFASGFIPQMDTVDQILAGDARQIFTVETESTIYRAHNLNEVMQIWRISRDKTPVVNVRKSG